MLAYSVGQQIALAAFNVICSLIAIFLMVRTLEHPQGRPAGPRGEAGG